MKTSNLNRNQIMEELEKRVLAGQRVSVKGVQAEFFTQQDRDSYALSLAVVRTWLSTLKRIFRVKHGLWFGNIDREGNFGLIAKEEEVYYANQQYYRKIKGMVLNNGALMNEGQKKGLLASPVERESLVLPYMRSLDEDKN